MGYRFNDNPPKPEDNLRKYAVRNGAIMRLAFGCYYLHSHDADFHDHIGWPNPDNPDHICQIRSNFRLYPYKDTVNLAPIHLRDEGYDEAVIKFEDDDLAQYVTAEAWIDEEDDNIVRVKVDTSYPTFHDKPIDLRFTLFVKNTNEQLIDAVCHDMISVLPGSPF